MSLGIPSVPSSTYVSTVSPPPAAAPSPVASAPSAAKGLAANRTLGGYVSSASSALTLLTQSGADRSQRNSTVADGPAGLSIAASGSDVVTQQTATSASLYAQEFEQTGSFVNVAGHLEAAGQYAAILAAASAATTGTTAAATGTTATASATAITIKASTGYWAEPGGDQVEFGTSFDLQFGSDPKQNDQIFIAANYTQGQDPAQATATLKQDMTGPLAQFFEYEGLSSDVAQSQAEQAVDYMFSLAAPVAGSYQTPTPPNSPPPAATS